ncbi:hypothetical protein HORIV_41070 [Vreelandella olivaria]|uniref:Uncharacterized protein n=1 Tax=Vreelandella olivaria TaxID=390919 RepID=A0ABM7GIC4_9GAMM|nr:hypothetical protein HORIV_41070 [Halomonas olivaria]
MGLGLPRLNLDQITGCHMGNAQRLGGKVVDDFKQRKIQRLLNLAL